MPARSAAQRAWSYTAAGRKALGASAPDFQHTPGKLPDRIGDMKKKPAEGSAAEEASESEAEAKAEGDKPRKKKASTSGFMNDLLRKKAGVTASKQ